MGKRNKNKKRPTVLSFASDPLTFDGKTIATPTGSSWEAGKIEEIINKDPHSNPLFHKMFLQPTKKTITDNLAFYKPLLVHFACHGTKKSLKIIKVDGSATDFFLKSLENLFANMSEDFVEFVVLNSCVSCNMAERLSEYVSFTTGWDHQVTNGVAWEYSERFYQLFINLRNNPRKSSATKNLPYEESYVRTCNAIIDGNIENEKLVPLMFRGCDRHRLRQIDEILASESRSQSSVTRVLEQYKIIQIKDSVKQSEVTELRVEIRKALSELLQTDQERRSSKELTIEDILQRLKRAKVRLGSTETDLTKLSYQRDEIIHGPSKYHLRVAVSALIAVIRLTQDYVSRRNPQSVCKVCISITCQGDYGNLSEEDKRREGDRLASKIYQMLGGNGDLPCDEVVDGSVIIKMSFAVEMAWTLLRRNYEGDSVVKEICRQFRVEQMQPLWRELEWGSYRAELNELEIGGAVPVVCHELLRYSFVDQEFSSRMLDVMAPLHYRERTLDRRAFLRDYNKCIDECMMAWSRDLLISRYMFAVCQVLKQAESEDYTREIVRRFVEFFVLFPDPGNTNDFVVGDFYEFLRFEVGLLPVFALPFSLGLHCQRKNRELGLVRLIDKNKHVYRGYRKTKMFRLQNDDQTQVRLPIVREEVRGGARRKIEELIWVLPDAVKSEVRERGCNETKFCVEFSRTELTGRSLKIVISCSSASWLDPWEFTVPNEFRFLTEMEESGGYDDNWRLDLKRVLDLSVYCTRIVASLPDSDSTIREMREETRKLVEAIRHKEEESGKKALREFVNFMYKGKRNAAVVFASASQQIINSAAPREMVESNELLRRFANAVNYEDKESLKDLMVQLLGRVESSGMNRIASLAEREAQLLMIGSMTNRISREINSVSLSRKGEHVRLMFADDRTVLDVVPVMVGGKVVESFSSLDDLAGHGDSFVILFLVEVLRATRREYGGALRPWVVDELESLLAEAEAAKGGRCDSEMHRLMSKLWRILVRCKAVGLVGMFSLSERGWRYAVSEEMCEFVEWLSEYVTRARDDGDLLEATSNRQFLDDLGARIDRLVKSEAVQDSDSPVLITLLRDNLELIRHSAMPVLSIERETAQVRVLLNAARFLLARGGLSSSRYLVVESYVVMLTAMLENKSQGSLEAVAAEFIDVLLSMGSPLLGYIVQWIGENMEGFEVGADEMSALKAQKSFPVASDDWLSMARRMVSSIQQRLNYEVTKVSGDRSEVAFNLEIADAIVLDADLRAGKRNWLLRLEGRDSVASLKYLVDLAERFVSSSYSGILNEGQLRALEKIAEDAKAAVKDFKFKETVQSRIQEIISDSAVQMKLSEADRRHLDEVIDGSFVTAAVKGGGFDVEHGFESGRMGNVIFQTEEAAREGVDDLFVAVD